MHPSEFHTMHRDMLSLKYVSKMNDDTGSRESDGGQERGGGWGG